MQDDFNYCALLANTNVILKESTKFTDTNQLEKLSEKSSSDDEEMDDAKESPFDVSNDSYEERKRIFDIAKNHYVKQEDDADQLDNDLQISIME